MLDKVIEKTNEYIQTMPKQLRKQYGQFFTSKETAVFMAKMFSVPKKEEVYVLDPGAGTGILACALIEEIQAKRTISVVHLTCYENDSEVLELLRQNLALIKAESEIKINVNLIEENYILSQEEDFNDKSDGIKRQQYDMIIGNPPYMKLTKDADEVKCMTEVCYGAPNMYFLFATMSLFNLMDESEMVYIIPRSWTSGAYFKKFRQYLFEHGVLAQVHLFVSRDKVFDNESVLQETMIVKIVKIVKMNKKPKNVLITSSFSNEDYKELKQLSVPYSFVVSGQEKYVYLVTNEEELRVLERVNRLSGTLESVGAKMKTGLVVDFRHRELLRSTETQGAVPLIYAQHINRGFVEFPIQKENEYVMSDRSGLIQENCNYLMVKRFTSKEEKRRLQSGIYLARKCSQYSYISTQNKVNFITGISESLSECMVFGLYVVFNSTIYDVYYRILNGSTQVNSTEINTIPMPDKDIIQSMGRKLMKDRDFSEEACNTILEGYL